MSKLGQPFFHEMLKNIPKNICVISTLHIISCIAFAVPPDSCDSLISKWQISMEQGKYGLVTTDASKVYYAEKDTLSLLSMYSSVMTGRAYALLMQKDSMNLWLKRAHDGAVHNDNAWAMGIVYSSQAMFAMDKEGNFYKAVSMFTKALEVTEGRCPESYYTIEGNLALVHYLRNEPSGLKYALDVLDYGKQVGDSLLMFIGSYTSGHLLHIGGEHEKAAEAVMSAVKTAHRFYNQAGVYALYADILLSLGNDTEALEYLEKASKYIDIVDVKSYIDVYRNYGKWLIKNEKSEEAVMLIERQLDKLGNKSLLEPTLYHYELYKVLAEAYKMEGDYGKAVHCLEIYNECTDSIFKLDREHSVNELLIRYETEKHRMKAYENEISLLKANKMITLISTLSVIIAGMLAAIIIIYIRKNRKYSEIVRKYKKKMERQEKQEKSSSENEKLMQVFYDLDNAMRVRHIYRIKGLTTETAAASINSNRTYISNAINLFAGVPFNSYVNKFRVDESVKILSDPNCDIPLKELSDYLGFSTVNSFCRIFKSAVGMPPSMFRTKMRK